MSQEPVTQSIVWKPQPGPQERLLTCPIEEIFYGGARGGGKTDGVIGSWLAHAGRHGAHARGIVFRRSMSELDEVLSRMMEIFPSIGAQYKVAIKTWELPNGSVLRLRFLDSDEDAMKYQGHAYSFMAFDEAGNWPTPKAIDQLRACLRSVHGIPVQLILTGNPGGVGHNWLKARYIDPATPMTPFQGPDGSMRVFIPSRLEDNRLLMEKDSQYANRLKGSGPAWLVRAWLEGDWNTIAGGMFDDVYRPSIHELDPFDIPRTWYINRSFDWGSSHPFSVGWWAESDGTEAMLKDGTKKAWPRGTIFRIAEWYGWNGNPDEGCKMLAVEIARGIVKTEKDVPWGGRVRPGPADNSIFDAENGMCIADDMSKIGVRWERSNKSPGSRKTGWEAMRKRFKACLTSPMEEPGLFVFNTCRNGFIRTVPTLPRDPNKAEDVNTASEDHAGDEVRYRCLYIRHTLIASEFRL